MINPSPSFSIIEKNTQELNKIKSQVKKKEGAVSKVFIDKITGELSSEIRFDRGLSRDRWQTVEVMIDQGDLMLETQGLTESAAIVVKDTLNRLKVQNSGR